MTAWTVPSYAEWAVPGFTEERLLGHGVSGRVVAAVNDANGQRVAIKYLNKDLVRDPEFLGPLRAEAEQLMQLNAPHMVRVFDYVEQPREGAAIVMELVDGVSLRQLLGQRGALSAPAALVVLKDVLLALAAAHAQRLPHRDVKPDNVLIASRGWCVLTDFGVAVKTDKQQRAAGTPEYMAPELWHGAPNVPANDIYAATAVFYESLTGKPPFSGRGGRLREHHESTPVPLENFGPPLADLIAWGMAKDLDARPASAMAFVSEVEGRAGAAYGPNWEDEGRRELAHRGAEAMPLQQGGTGGGSAGLSRIARRKMVAYVSVGAAAVIALAAAGFVVLSKSSGQQIQLSSVNASSIDPEITVSHPKVTSKCAAATAFNFTGSISDLDSGPVSYQWVYSNGQQSPVQTLKFTGTGQQLAVKPGTVSTNVAGDGWAELKVLLNPGAVTSDKATYSLQCSSANSDVAVTTTVKPASLAYSSCSAPHPTLTVTGTITAKNPGTVSYYWSMSNGEKTKPDEAIFTAAGTKPADPLTFPAWVPASGDVTLVVTKPVVMKSKPAVYSVTCGPHAAADAAANAAANSATPTPGTSSVKASVTPTAPATVATTPVTTPPSTPVTVPPSIPVSVPPSTPVTVPPSIPVSVPPSTPVTVPPSTPVTVPPSTPVTPAA